MSKSLEKPDETLSTVQPFEFTKEFNKQLKDLDLLETIDHIKERSEEHTSELQSRTNLVCRLLLEKKKQKNKKTKKQKTTNTTKKIKRN